MLNFLSAGSQKQVIGFSLTPGIGLEAVIYDKAKGCVLNYGRRKVEYDFSRRVIQDYGQFKSALAQLIDELKIPPKAMAYLVLPNIYFSFIKVLPDTVEAEIRMAVLSEAEEFYMFKKEEPVSGWCEVANPEGDANRRLAFSSFQKSAIDEIKEQFVDVGLELVGIENSYSATLRGLSLTSKIDTLILEESSWTAMIVNTNSFVLFQMEGKNVIDFSEVPLAIKSFSTEEAYQAIVSSASQLLMNHASMYLYIISQTDEICADTLKKQMQFDREIVAIDTNKYSQNSIVEVLTSANFNDTKALTLAAIGAANSKTDFGLTLNVMADDPASSMGVYFTTSAFGSPMDITQGFVVQVCVTFIAIFALIFGAIIGVGYFFDTQWQSKLSEKDGELQRVQQLIDASKKVEPVKETEEIDMTVVIDEVADSNVKAISFYDSIATDIPKKVWLTQYYNKAGDRLAVRGIAESIIDIYEYYKNLRVVCPQSDIRLTELKVVTQDSESTNKFIAGLNIDKDVDRLYSFEISNTSIDIGSSQDQDGGSPEDAKRRRAEEENNLLYTPPQVSIEEPSDQMTPEE